MRGLRSFVVLLVILIGLGAYLYFVESKRPAGESGPEKEKVFGVDSEKIEEIAVRSESGERTTLRKSGEGGWQIVAPAQGQADVSEVSGLLTNLSTLEVQSVVDENPPDLKEYGLAQPRVEVTFKADGQEHTLQIGQKTPPGSDLYAKRGNANRVFLISSFLDSTFNRTTFDLRDKAVVKVDRDKLDAVDVNAGGRSLRFAKSGGEWRIAQPVEGRADFSAVEGLVGRISGLQMKSVASAEGGDLKKFGLEPPAATVRMHAGSSQATVLVGGKAEEEGSIYVKDAARPAVYAVDASILEELKKDAGEFRQKDLFDARAFNANRVEITRGGQTMVFEKTRAKNKEGQEEEKWRQLAPGEARDVDQAKADALITAITGTRAASFVAAGTKTGLESPEIAVTVKFDDSKKEERVTLARVGADAYASRAGEAAVAKIETSSLDAIVKALEELK
jgi:hypothetical protein